jgi:uncharacterized protein (TIGR00375 family)
MKFIADLHIHSKFSMATAKNLDLEHMYIAAQLKGIQVLATGDATHPGWMAEIKEKLVPAEKGLFKLKANLAEKCDQQIPPACRGMVRFILESEISSIYKKNGRTRKNHNLVFLPDLDAAERFNSRLDKIGNIKSDGRPILGLDSRDLLEILLETTGDGFLIPAHIWTPWFSLFGSKSGFDAIEECFEDLSSNIFAVETGLSSDPLMNWRVKELDGLTLVSNSDAHSPMKLGREANLLDTDLSFAGIKTALESGDPESFLGTFEFYPEEGKYYLDGHRKCSICFKPHETIAADGICPVCGKPLTLGVLYRVEELAGRPAGEKPGHTHPFYSIAPLVDILSEIFRVGPQSKKVIKYYNSALARLGSEFSILHDLKIAYIEKAGIPLIGEAIRRMRSKEMHVVPGYDGEYGVIKFFTDSEREELLGQKTLFSIPEIVNKIKLKKKAFPETLRKKKPGTVKKKHQKAVVDLSDSSALETLNEKQKKAVLHKNGPLMIVAGPGTGKTRTITGRIAHIIKARNVPSENILAVTFTLKAAREMRDRLLLMLGNGFSLPLCSTLHSLCYLILDEQEKSRDICVIDDRDRNHIIRTAIRRVERRKGKISLHKNKIENIIISAKQKLLSPEDESAINKIAGENHGIVVAAIYKEYQQIMSLLSLCDYEDLILKTALLFENNRSALEKYRYRFKYIFVDEYQDLNYGQYRIIKALSPPGKDLCVIGDPDQSIYGFRGSDKKYFKDFVTDYPDATVIRLTRNYRSAQTILDASYQALAREDATSESFRIYSEIKGKKTIGIIETGSEKAEAVAVGRRIEQMVGGTGFHSMDFDKIDLSSEDSAKSFSNFAVLYRTNNQGMIIAEQLEAAGIPCQIASREKLYEQKTVADLLAWLKITEKQGTFLDFERIVKTGVAGIGAKTLEKLVEWGLDNNFTLHETLYNIRRFSITGIPKKQQELLGAFLGRLKDLEKGMAKMTLANRLKYILDQTGMADATCNDSVAADKLRTLISFAEEFSCDSKKFLAEIALGSDTDLYEHNIEKVSLMTLHASKGLEFPVVFITGCEDGLIPYKKLEEHIPDIEEEKRLFFVGMTRAKEVLFFTWAKKRRIFGRLTMRKLSPFVRNIEEHLQEREKQALQTRKQRVNKQMQLF